MIKESRKTCPFMSKIINSELEGHILFEVTCLGEKCKAFHCKYGYCMLISGV